MIAKKILKVVKSAYAQKSLNQTDFKKAEDYLESLIEGEEDQLSDNTFINVDRDDPARDDVAEGSDHTDLTKLGGSEPLKILSDPDSKDEGRSSHHSKAESEANVSPIHEDEGPAIHESKANEGPSGHESKVNDEI